VFNQQFTDLSSAQAYFSDNVLDLGTVSGSVSLTFNLTLSGDDQSGDAFGTDVLAAVIPEPPTLNLLLLLSAVLFLCSHKYRERNRAG
jgi:hypothetical protein